MIRWRSKFFHTLLIFSAISLSCLSLYAAMYCSVCKRQITGSYIKSGDKVLCSQSCLDKTLPRCAICGKVCNGGFQKNGKFYCSKPCLEKTLPKCALCGKPFSFGMLFSNNGKDGPVYCAECAAKPKCFACTLPNDCEKLSDGRYICRNCKASAVFNEEQALQIFNDVRKRLYEELGYSTQHNIEFYATDAKNLEAKSKNYSPGQELGLYVCNFTINTVTKTKVGWNLKAEEKTEEYKSNEKFSVYVLYGLPRKKLIEVCGHELAHDWMQENFPKTQDIKLKEGWAEYIATRINDLYEQSEMNKRMEENKDPVYGDGYRMVKDFVKQNGVKNIGQLFRQHEGE